MKYINCEEIFNDLIKDVDTESVSNLSTFYTDDSRNTLSYIKAMKKLEKYGVKLNTCNVSVSEDVFLDKIAETHRKNRKVMILEPFQYDYKDLIFNNVDKNNKLTSQAVLAILERVTDCKDVLIIGRHLGLDVANLLLKNDYSITITHSKTENLKNYTKQAKVIVSCVGKSNIITKDMVTESAIILDVGLGDVADNVAEIAKVTPKINGTGLITNAMLIREVKGI